MAKVKIPRVCSLPECNKPLASRKMCSMHSTRLARYGDPFFVKVAKGDPRERFWLTVQKTDTCWIWTGFSKRGYGVLKIDGKPVFAHRFSYFLHYGRWPEPNCLHSCDNPPCVNPNHLREGTHADNKVDCVTRDRHAKGSKIGQAKLTELAVLDIKGRLAKGESIESIAYRHNISKPTIFNIRAGRVWGWLKDQDAG